MCSLAVDKAFATALKVLLLAKIYSCFLGCPDFFGTISEIDMSEFFIVDWTLA